MTKQPKKPRAPAHLRPATRQWFLSVLAEYQLEQHHIRLLTMAGEAWDQNALARAQLAKDGLCFTDDRKNIRPHPAVAIARDAKVSFSRLLRELDLDCETPAPGAPRPPSLRSNRGRMAHYVPTSS